MENAYGPRGDPHLAGYFLITLTKMWQEATKEVNYVVKFYGGEDT